MTTDNTADSLMQSRIRELEQQVAKLEAVADAADAFLPLALGCKKIPAARTLSDALVELWQSRGVNFVCPKCGGPFCGRDLETNLLHCHGDSSYGTRTCDWVGEWPLDSSTTKGTNPCAS